MATEIKTVFISSAARDPKDTGESYTVFLQTPVKDIFKAELLYASIPNTILNITNGSNVITTNVNGNGSNTFSIPTGFYSAGGIASEITNAINLTTGITLAYLGNEGRFIWYKLTEPFTVAINTVELATILGMQDSGTNFSSIPCPSNPTPPDTIYPFGANNSLYKNTYGNYYKTPTITNAQPIDLFILDIAELKSPTMFTGISSNCYGSSGFNPFAIIPNDVISGNYINYRKNTNFDFAIEYPYPIERLDRLTIRWTDINNKLLNFNGIDDNFIILRLHTTRKNFLTR